MTSPRETGTDKSALRSQVLARRAAQPEAGRTAASAAIVAALLPGLAKVRAFAAYVPEETEPGHGRLPAAYTQLGARVLLPVVPPGGEELAWAVDTGRLAPGRFGLLEPLGPRLGPTAIGTADVVVVPALSVARDGVRLGRGGATTTGPCCTPARTPSSSRWCSTTSSSTPSRPSRTTTASTPSSHRRGAGRRYR